MGQLDQKKNKPVKSALRGKSRFCQGRESTGRRLSRVENPIAGQCNCSGRTCCFVFARRNDARTWKNRHGAVGEKRDN